MNPRPDSVLPALEVKCGPMRAYGSMEARHECGTAVVRNRAGVTSSRELQSKSDPDAVVWRGSESRDSRDTPLGHHDYVLNHLERVADEHQRFMDMLPSESSWLLLVHCASARANYLLRTLCPDSVRGFAEAPTEACGECVCTLLDIPRRGWHNEQWAQDWLRILMGPRHPPVRWPDTHQNRHERGKKPDIQKRGCQESEAGVRTRKTEPPLKGPVDSSGDGLEGRSEGTRLEVALAALEDSDDADGAEATALKEALKKARAQAAPTQFAVSTNASSMSPVQPDDLKRPKQLSQKHSWQQGLPFWKICASILSPTDGSFRGQFRVKGSPPTGGPTEARTRCVDVDFRRLQAHGRIGNTIRRSSCKAQMCGEPERNAVIGG